jgi:hypothetical protein
VGTKLTDTIEICQTIGVLHDLLLDAKSVALPGLQGTCYRTLFLNFAQQGGSCSVS